jgi:hypothetical protein
MSSPDYLVLESLPIYNVVLLRNITGSSYDPAATRPCRKKVPAELIRLRRFGEALMTSSASRSISKNFESPFATASKLNPFEKRCAQFVASGRESSVSIR